MLRVLWGLSGNVVGVMGIVGIEGGLLLWGLRAVWATAC